MTDTTLMSLFKQPPYAVVLLLTATLFAAATAQQSPNMPIPGSCFINCRVKSFSCIIGCRLGAISPIITGFCNRQCALQNFKCIQSCVSSPNQPPPRPPLVPPPPPPRRPILPPIFPRPPLLPPILPRPPLLPPILPRPPRLPPILPRPPPTPTSLHRVPSLSQSEVYSPHPTAIPYPPKDPSSLLLSESVVTPADQPAASLIPAPRPGSSISSLHDQVPSPKSSLSQSVVFSPHPTAIPYPPKAPLLLSESVVTPADQAAASLIPAPRPGSSISKPIVYTSKVAPDQPTSIPVPPAKSIESSDVALEPAASDQPSRQRPSSQSDEPIISASFIPSPKPAV